MNFEVVASETIGNFDATLEQRRSPKLSAERPLTKKTFRIGMLECSIEECIGADKLLSCELFIRFPSLSSRASYKSLIELQGIITAASSGNPDLSDICFEANRNHSLNINLSAIGQRYQPCIWDALQNIGAFSFTPELIEVLQSCTYPDIYALSRDRSTENHNSNTKRRRTLRDI